MEQGRCGNRHLFPWNPGTGWGCRSPGKEWGAVTRHSVSVSGSDKAFCVSGGL